MDFWFDGSSAWRKAGFGLLGLDYNKKDEAIDKCHNSKYSFIYLNNLLIVRTNVSYHTFIEMFL